MQARSDIEDCWIKGEPDSVGEGQEGTGESDVSMLTRLGYSRGRRVCFLRGFRLLSARREG